MNEEKKMEVTNRATDILFEVGIPANLRGFHYLRYGILVAYEDYKSVANRTTKFLYPRIAEEFDTKGSRVERAIRHAIEVAFDRASAKSIAKYFGRTPSAESGKSKNAQFIMILADRLLREDGICPKI